MTFIKIKGQQSYDIPRCHTWWERPMREGLGLHILSILNIMRVDKLERLRERFVKPCVIEILPIGLSGGFPSVTSLVIRFRSVFYRGVVPGCAGCAMAHPEFGRSVNPISTRGDRLCPPNYYWHPRIFRPSDGPALPNC